MTRKCRLIAPARLRYGSLQVLERPVAGAHLSNLPLAVAGRPSLSGHAK